MVAPQQPQREPVEGSDEGTEVRHAQKHLGPLSHLSRRLVRERHGSDPTRVHSALANEPGDPIGDHAGLPGAGPRQHQLGASFVGHGFELLWVQRLFPVDGRRPGRKGSG